MRAREAGRETVVEKPERVSWEEYKRRGDGSGMIKAKFVYPAEDRLAEMNEIKSMGIEQLAKEMEGIDAKLTNMETEINTYIEKVKGQVEEEFEAKKRSFLSRGGRLDSSTYMLMVSDYNIALHTIETSPEVTSMRRQLQSIRNRKHLLNDAKTKILHDNEEMLIEENKRKTLMELRRAGWVEQYDDD